MTIFFNKLKGISKSIRPFIPHLREIDEASIAQKFSTKPPTSSSSSSVILNPSNDLNQNNDLKPYESQETKNDTQLQTWEIRDEANRRWWWSMFNEYEYRHNSSKQDNHKWYHWFEDTDTPEEKRLILKLDLTLCLFAFILYWVKYLDQTNMNNAYISGMKESLNMKGNDLVNTNAVYLAGAIIFQVPMMYLVHRYPTNFLLPLLDFGWGSFTLAIYKCNNVAELKAFRFFVGAFESGFYPTIYYLFGSWYKPSEFARRGGVFYFGNILGVVTAGLLQASAFENLNGKNGLEGWRWMFILDAIITLPIALIGLWFLPGTPKKCYSVFLTDEDIYLARKRLLDANIALESEGPHFFTISLWKDIIVDWRFYFFVFVNILAWHANYSGTGAFILWLKSLGEYSIPKVNKLSTLAPALGFIWILLTVSISDMFRSRWLAILISQTINIIGCIFLSIWSVPKGMKWFSYCVMYFGAAISPVIYSWASDAMRHNPQKRAIIIIAMNLIAQTSTTITSLFIWKTSEAPRFLKGYTTSAATSLVIILAATFILPYNKKEERKHAADNGILLYNSALGEDPPSLPQSPNPKNRYSANSLDEKQMGIINESNTINEISSNCSR